MYRYAIFAVAALMLAACSHGGGIGMDFNANPNISGNATMETLTVKWFGDAAAGLPSTEVKIDAARGIVVTAELLAADGTVIDSCTGSTELLEEDYQAVVAKVVESDLANFAPPIEGDASCIVDETPANFGMVYEYLQAEQVQNKAFDADGCEIPPAIEDLAAMVDDLAVSNVTDCSAELLLVQDEKPVALDTDGDCITDEIESATGTDSAKADTDGDGLPDGWVTSQGLGEDVDCDGDKDLDANGGAMETDPKVADTDNDGQNDLVEMTCGDLGFTINNLAIALDPDKSCTDSVE